MSRSRFGFLSVAVLVALGVGLMNVPQSISAQDAKPAAKAEAKKAPAKTRGRLPAYYGEVVDKAQREKIYAIQAGYADKIEALEAQLKEINDKMSSEVRAVLTPEQQKKVDELAAAAKGKRQQKAPAGETTPAPAKAGEAAAPAKAAPVAAKKAG
jgi:flagellar basal body-associated protein FliL